MLLQPNVYSWYQLIRPFGVPVPPVSVYCNGVFVNCIEAQKKVFARIAEVELSVWSVGSFLRAIRVGPVKRMS